VSDACTGSPDPTPAVTDTATVTVAVFAPLTVSAGGDILVCPGDLVNIAASITGGGNPYVYSWTTVAGSGTVDSPSSLLTSVLANGSGTYQISVVDVCLNAQSDQVTINVEPSCILNIPNIITPDGHGPTVNEFFFIDNLDKFPGSTLQIFNRWGNKIYESDDYKNNWNGSKYVDGVYYYILTVPVAGTTLAKAEDSPSYKAESADASKVFAGFFQITRMQ
jgi:gliding motility-associated-like protein